MKKRTARLIFIALFLACFSLGVVIYQVGFNKIDDNSLKLKNKSGNTTSEQYGLTDKISDGVILQAWSWSFNTIKECMADIAYAGFSTIQTSPANECIVGGNGGMQLFGDGKWYYHYQPTDWTIGNYQLGTRDEFKAMCDEADKYGIKVIVDVVPNHTGDMNSVKKNLIDVVGTRKALYHPTGATNITQWGNRLQCTMYAMTGLLDVNTENPPFQDYFIKYLNDCIACGADGFRYDTAKHIALPDDPTQGSYSNNFWTRVTSEITNSANIFNYGEVLQGDNDRMIDYIKAIGHTTASNYGASIRSSVIQKSLSTALLTRYSTSADPSKLVTWVESHDNYINDGNYKMTEEQIIFGWSLIASTGKGTPLFFSRPYGSSPDNMWGNENRIGVAGSDFYKDDRVVALNRFHNACQGEDLISSNLDSSKNCIFIQRGSKGAVIVNMGSTLSVSADTKLKDGTYIDRVDNKNSFTVSGGKITGSVNAMSITVLCNDSAFITTDKAAVVGLDSNTQFTITTGSQEVTLKAANATKATYSIDDGSETEYTDGTKITVTPKSSTLKLVLKGTNSANQTSVRTLIFIVKSSVESGAVIKFTKPAEWKSTIYAYVYNEAGGNTLNNAEWPGKPMTLSSGSTYTYTVTQKWPSAMIIFSDGTNQYPGANEPGEELVNGKTYTVK